MDNWRQNLDQAFGEAPSPPADEYERILRRARSRDQFWPALLCAASLAFAILVSLFVSPSITTTEASASLPSMLSVDITSPYDESLEGLQDLADQIK